jgi:hypothetical protein
MTTTYYPQPSPAPRPFDRAYPGHQFGYDEPRQVMHDNFPAAMPQPAGPSRTPSALRNGVLLLGAVAAVGAGVLIGVTLFGKDGSASTPTQPVYWVPGTDGNPAASPMPTPVILPAQEPKPVVIPAPSGVVPGLGDDFTVTVPVPPAGNPTPAPPPPATPKIEPKVDPVKPAPPIDPKKLDPTVDPPGPGAPKIDPKKLDPTIDPPGPKLDPPVVNPAKPPCGVLSC